MTNEDYYQRLDELDRLLNDPTVPIEPARIWRLIEELAEHDSLVLATIAENRKGVTENGQPTPHNPVSE